MRLVRARGSEHVYTRPVCGLPLACPASESGRVLVAFLPFQSNVESRPPAVARQARSKCSCRAVAFSSLGGGLPVNIYERA